MSRGIAGLHALVQFAPFVANTPERMAFKALLEGVASALHAIERTELGDACPDVEAKAIRACLDSAASPEMMELHARLDALADAFQALRRSEMGLKRLRAPEVVRSIADDITSAPSTRSRIGDAH